jgi:hypothetical protein
MNFNTTKNKEFLWKLMYDNGLFNNLDNKYATEVHTYFDMKMNYIDTNKKANDTLTILNKQTISEMMNDIKIKFPAIEKKKITSKELLEDRQNIFNQKLNNVKNEFESLMNIKKPEIIDFTDKIEEILII